jgi:hypothetical protein
VIPHGRAVPVRPLPCSRGVEHVHSDVGSGTTRRRAFRPTGNSPRISQIACPSIRRSATAANRSTTHWRPPSLGWIVPLTVSPRCFPTAGSALPPNLRSESSSYRSSVPPSYGNEISFETSTRGSGSPGLAWVGHPKMARCRGPALRL